ncbi:protein-L-isoaspartate O-methyltransferase [Pilimelia anulata]|uniref:Protein-L-isoaspartate O-methyltransferase n=1 Tax=Pilimelia anulata TaxID=53371 RepID=A0A8J3F897_9ACTN|nr:methyltransferase domain-containing protein [Pilimelia anulata]GGJ84582.1 protein-L-isoaspartate O-methyltransferase [Pilimelia anulata]
MSLPSLVAVMLTALAVADGQRVLEIGTGSGYHTALLCHRLGAANVVSVDIDPDLTAAAAQRLAALDLHPRIDTGDGAAGVAGAAPFDRIIATGAAARVPAAWIEQLAPAGRIVAPFTFGGALAVLDGDGTGAVTGRLHAEQAWFMPLRAADRALSDDYPTGEDPPTGTTGVGGTDVPAAVPAEPDFRLWLRLHLPPGHLVDVVDDAGNPAGLAIHAGTARATADYTGGRARVVQDDHRLWDAVEVAHAAWLRVGRPDRTRLGITARAGGEQYAWLDDPGTGPRWPLPA